MFEDPADLAVIALHVRFLRRAVGVAVEHADASRHLQRRVVDRVGTVFFDHFGVRELGAVVGEDDAEELPEELRPRDVPEAVEDAGAGLRALVVAQEPEHDPARQVDREEHLASDLSDDRVEFRPLGDVVRVAEHGEFPVRAPDAALRVGLRLFRLLPLSAAARFGKVAADDVEEPSADVVVHGALLDPLEDLGIVADDVPDRLPLEDAGGENRVHLLDAFVGGMDAAPRNVENAVVVRVGAFRRIDALHHRAGREVPAAVADVRRHEEPFALALDEVWADLEASRRAVERALCVPSVALEARTAVEQCADAV